MDATIFRDLIGSGVEAKQLSILQLSLRAIIVFIAAVALVRIADKRFLSRKTPYDAALGFIMASMLARAINGSAPLVPTLVGGLTLALFHRLAAAAAMRFHWFSRLLKGSSELVIDDGKLMRQGLNSNLFSDGDLEEDLRLSGVAAVEQVQSAFIERNGALSVIKKN
jgi:uncharacterized membrane protein YcaP (DUF421 family)